MGLVLPMEVPFPASNAERSLLYHSPPPDNPESAQGAKENSLNDVGNSQLLKSVQISLYLTEAISIPPEVIQRILPHL